MTYPMLFSRVRTARTRTGTYTLFLVLVAISACGQDLPAGWRRPSGKDVSVEWRKKSPTRFLKVDGDFDGDGNLDFAGVLISTSSKRCALFVRLSTDNHNWGEPIWQSDMPGCGHFGIDIVRPGKHNTLCSSDPSSCDPKTPTSVILTSDGIAFSSYGTGSSLAYWDRVAKKFQWVPLSD